MKSKSHLWSLALLITILLNLSIHVYLASHTRLISDDYCSAAMAKRLGIARASWYWYLNWSGRYSASVLDSTFGLLGPRATGITVPILLCAWLSALALSIHKWISFQNSRFPSALLLGANVLFLTILLSPNIRQSMYWGQGLRSVLPPIVLMTLYVGWFRWLQMQLPNKNYSRFWLLASFAYSFGAGGFSETFTSLQVVLCSTALFFQLMTQNRSSQKTVATPILISALAGTALAFFIVVVAPGNAFRQAESPPVPDPVNILLISARSFGSFWLGLVNSTDKVLGIIGGLGIGLFVGSQTKPIHISRMTWLIIPLLTLGLMFICFPPAAYGLSDAPPSRTLIIPVYMLAAAITGYGYLIGNQLQQGPTGLRWIQVLSIISVIAFILSSLLADSKLLASRGIFIDFADKWDNIHVQIQQARTAGLDQAVVETMDDVNWAGATTIHDNSRFWLNRCVSQYYGISTIAVDEPDSYQR